MINGRASWNPRYIFANRRPGVKICENDGCGIEAMFIVDSLSRGAIFYTCGSCQPLVPNGEILLELTVEVE